MGEGGRGWERGVGGLTMHRCPSLIFSHAAAYLKSNTLYKFFQLGDWRGKLSHVALNKPHLPYILKGHTGVSTTQIK